jgi:hypothetical protein
MLLPSPVVCILGILEAANKESLEQSYRAVFHVYLKSALLILSFMSLHNTLEILASLGKAVKLSTLAKMAGFKTAYNPEFRQQLKELKRQGVIELIQSGWRSEERSSKNHHKVVILKADVWRLQDIAEPKSRHNQVLMMSNMEAKKESVQKLIRKRRCSRCPDFEKLGNVGSCKKFGWEMSLELAEKQTLCYFP